MAKSLGDINDDITDFIKTKLLEVQPRNDYQELLELCLPRFRTSGVIPAMPQFRNLKVLKITDYTYEIAKLMHQYSKNILPSCFLTFFSSLSKIHNRQSRSKSKK